MRCMECVGRYHWNLKDFLPRLIQIPFVSAISEFLVRPHRKFLKLGKPPRDAESQELTVVQTTFNSMVFFILM